MASALLVPAAQAAEPRTSTGKWVVNFAEAQCIASREFGTAEKPLTLVLKAPATGDVLQVAVLRKGARGGNAEQLSGSLTWGPLPKRQMSTLAYSPDKVSRRVFLFNVPRTEVALWTGDQALSLSAGNDLRETFAVSGLSQVLKVMDECVADLRNYWNFTERDAPSKLPQRASANLPKLFDTDDYPYVAVRAEEEGEVHVVLLVNEAGKVADCTLVKTSGIASLDAQTCAVIMDRAKYKPAMAADGKPARDVDFARIRWLMP